MEVRLCSHDFFSKKGFRKPSGQSYQLRRSALSEDTHMSILEQIDEIGTMQPSKCKRYGCKHVAATSRGDCLLCDAKDREAAQTVAVIERRGHVVMWLILAVLAGFFVHGIYLASRP